MIELLAFGLPGGPEMLIVLVILVFLFGARQIPKLARSLGSGVCEFQAGLEDGAETAREETSSINRLVSDPTGSTEADHETNEEDHSS